MTRDMYNGALDDLNLTTDPFTSNRYAFGGGNPLSNIEIDGHLSFGDAWNNVTNWTSEHSEQISSALGHGIEMAAGIWLMQLGEGIAAGGGALCATGVGCFGGAPAIAAGAAITLTGGAMAAHGALGLAQDATAMLATSSGGGGGAGGGSAGGSSSREILRVPRVGETDGGPGRWVRVNRRPAEDALSFQEEQTGVVRELEYRVDVPGSDPVEFDGFRNGKLIDAKAEYSHLLDEKGNWQKWFTKASEGGKRPSGLQRLINEAKRQEKAANGTPVEWRVRDTPVANAIRRVFRENDIGIDVVDVSKPTTGGTRMRMI